MTFSTYIATSAATVLDLERVYLTESTDVLHYGGFVVPLFLAKSEVFAWFKDGRKTIEIRLGGPWSGETAVVQSGRKNLWFRIVKKETGKLTEVITAENYRSVIPVAKDLDSARDYVAKLYDDSGKLFTAYYLGHQELH